MLTIGSTRITAPIVNLWGHEEKQRDLRNVITQVINSILDFENNGLMLTIIVGKK